MVKKKLNSNILSSEISVSHQAKFQPNKSYLRNKKATKEVYDNELKTEQKKLKVKII